MKSIKKYNDFLNENSSSGKLNLKDMEIGLDLTKIRTDEYVYQKTIEYVKENIEIKNEL